MRARLARIYLKEAASGLKRETVEWPPPYQVVFCGTKLALPAHLLELAKQTGGSHESRDLRQGEYGQQWPRPQMQTRQLRELHRAPVSTSVVRDSTAIHLRTFHLTRKNRPLAGAVQSARSNCRFGRTHSDT